MKTSASTARQALRSLGARGKTTRIPNEVRLVVEGYVHEARSAGQSWGEIAEAVVLSKSVLMRWNRSDRKKRARLRPVVIQEMSQSADHEGIVLITGHGERFEGLRVEDTIRILRELR